MAIALKTAFFNSSLRLPHLWTIRVSICRSVQGPKTASSGKLFHQLLFPTKNAVVYVYNMPKAQFAESIQCQSTPASTPAMH